jgi:hypothetical protein
MRLDLNYQISPSAWNFDQAEKSKSKANPGWARMAEFRGEDPNALTRAAIPPKVTIDRKPQKEQQGESRGNRKIPERERKPMRNAVGKYVISQPVTVS